MNGRKLPASYDWDLGTTFVTSGTKHLAIPPPSKEKGKRR